MSLKNQDIYDLMDRFVASGIARLKLTSGDSSLELERDGAIPPAPPAGPAVAAAPVPVPAATPAVPSAPAAPAAAPVEPAPEAPEAEALPTIDAPLVGTFYVAPAPDKDPFVQVGSSVKKGETVCLLEAMKMMSEVAAPCDCVIEQILVTDGELVSFGAPLIAYREL